MALDTTSILGLPVAISLTGAEYAPLVQGGTTKRAQVSAFDLTGTLPGSAQSANTGLFGPVSGAAALPTFRTLKAADLTGGSGGTAGYLLGTDGTTASWQGFLQGGTGAVTRTWQSKAREAVTPQDFSSVTGLDSASIQLALNYVHSLGGGVVYCPKGIYVLTATLTMYPKTQLVGAGFGATIFYRASDYGDTLAIGALGSSGLGAQSVKVIGIYFLNDAAATWTGTPAHIRLNHAQDAEIAWCWLQGLYGHISVEGGTKINVHDNDFGVSGATGAYSLRAIIDSADGTTFVTNLTLANNYFAASGYTTAVYWESVEVGEITGGYIGGYTTNSIWFNATTILSGISVSSVFLDPTVSNTGQTIKFTYNTTNAIDVTISGNNFYGLAGSKNHIFASVAGSNISVADLTITGNTLRDSYGASIKLLGALGVDIVGNVITGYNYANTSLVDPEYAAGIYIVGPNATHINAAGNNFGASGWVAGASGANYTVWGVYTASTSTTSNITLCNNEGVMRTGGAIVSGDVPYQRTLTSSTDKALVRAIGANGDLQGSVVSISDTGAMLGLISASFGTVTVQAISGTYNFNLPTTAGTAGYVLTSGGGGGSANTWTNPTSLGIDLDIGSTAITGGATTRILYDNAGVLGEYTLTGSGTVAVMQNTPTLTTPVIGAATGTSAVLTNQIWSGSVSSALSTLTGATDGFRSSAANVTQYAGENTTASSATQGGFFGGYSNDGAAMAIGDRLGGIRAGGSSSASSLRNAALIGAFADQAWVDVSAYGSRWEFQTTSNGATSATTKLILDNAGILSFSSTVRNASAPALVPSSAILRARVGDDSAYCAFEALTFNKVTIIAPASSATLTIADGKSLTVSNILTLAGTDSSTLNIGTGGTLGTAAFKATGTSGNTVPLLDGTNTWSNQQTFSSKLTVNIGRSGFAANSELFAVAFAYNSTRLAAAEVAYFGASDASTPDLQISNAGGGSVAIFKNSRVVQFPGYTAGLLNTDASGNITASATVTAVGTGAKTISSSADSSTNLGHYLTVNLGGTTYYIPCGSVALT